jgi:hypothetical protein
MALSLCSASVANTGELACDKSRGVLRKIAIFNGEIAAADYADETTFFNKLIANSKLSKDDSNKLFIINEAQDIADASEANKEGTLNLGFKTTLLEGKPAYNFKVFAGSDLLKRLRTFNNQTVRIIEFDANGVIWGLKSGTKFKGFQAKLFFSGNKIATGQNVEEGVVQVSASILSASEYFDNPVWAETPADASLEDIQALIDVTMSEDSHSSNVWQIAMKIPGSNLIEDYNIYDDYMDAIDALTFTAGTGTNYGTSLAITSVAKNASLKTLAVTFDSTAYTALPGGTKIKLTGPTPATLDAADVTGIELLPVILTK